MSPEAPPRPPPVDGRSSPPIQLRAVALGVVADWVATWLVSYAILFAALAIASSRYDTGDQMEAYLEQLAAAPDFVVLTSLVGLLCVALGGFLAVAIARVAPTRHAIAVGLCSLALSLALDMANETATEGWKPMWFQVLCYLLVVPSALVGGGLARRTRS